LILHRGELPAIKAVQSRIGQRHFSLGLCVPRSAPRRQGRIRQRRSGAGLNIEIEIPFLAEAIAERNIS